MKFDTKSIWKYVPDLSISSWLLYTEEENQPLWETHMKFPIWLTTWMFLLTVTIWKCCWDVLKSVFTSQKPNLPQLRWPSLLPWDRNEDNKVYLKLIFKGAQPCYTRFDKRSLKSIFLHWCKYLISKLVFFFPSIKEYLTIGFKEH